MAGKCALILPIKRKKSSFPGRVTEWRRVRDRRVLANCACITSAQARHQCQGGLMDRYIPPDARDLAADTDFAALAAQDPVWVPPPPQPRNPSASRREFIKGVIASGSAVSALSYSMGGASPAQAQQRAPAPERLLSININGQVRRADV